MNNLAKRTVDELMRVIVPHQTREAMGWDTNTALAMTVDGTSKTVTLNAAVNGNDGVLCHMDEYCRITLPKAVREIANISAKDVLTFKADAASGMLVMCN